MTLRLKVFGTDNKGKMIREIINEDFGARHISDWETAVIQAMKGSHLLAKTALKNVILKHAKDGSSTTARTWRSLASLAAIEAANNNCEVYLFVIK